MFWKQGEREWRQMHNMHTDELQTQLEELKRDNDELRNQTQTQTHELQTQLEELKKEIEEFQIQTHENELTSQYINSSKFSVCG